MVQLSIDTKVRGLFLKDPVKASRIFVDEWENFLEEASSFTLRRATIGTPVWQGTLANSEFREIRGNGLDMFAIIATPSIYAEPIETGQFPAKYPNIASIADWVRGKLGISDPGDIERVSFLIARAIKTRAGFKKAHWMFRNAFAMLSNKAQGMLNKAANRIIKRWDK